MANNRSVKVALMVALCFFLPFLIAWVMFAYHDTLHLKQTNKGELIHPFISGKHFNIIFPGGQHFTWEDTKKHWSLLYVGAGCLNNKTVVSHIDQLSHMHAAMGKDDLRLKMIYMLPAHCAMNKLVTKYEKVYPDFKFGRMPAAQFRQWQAKRPHHKGYYLMDPLQNIMMYYSVSTSAKDIYHDVKHLLQVSQIG